MTAVTTSATLYQIESELIDLISLREQMVDAGENTEAIDVEIKATAYREIRKVDGVARMLSHFKAQAMLAKDEEGRLKARRRKFESAIDRLEGLVIDTLQELAQPLRGAKQLEGQTATFSLRTAGGAQKLTIAQDTRLVPDNLKLVRVTMSYRDYEKLDLEQIIIPTIEVIPIAEAIRAELAKPCETCEGAGRYGGALGAPCPGCNGTGKRLVAGCKLEPRAVSLIVR